MTTGRTTNSPGRLQGSHLVQAARGHFAAFDPRLTTALAVAGALPPYTATALRLMVLRTGGVRIGERTGIGGRLWISGGLRAASRIEIGADCFLNDGCRFDVSAPVTIGDHVYLGHDVAVLTASHELGDSSHRAGTQFAEPITIGRGSWVGARSTVLAGVVVGQGSIVAAGAVVTRSVPPNTLVGGVPAKVIRELDD
jgi:maltose O-acetyltransferase